MSFLVFVSYIPDQSLHFLCTQIFCAFSLLCTFRHWFSSSLLLFLDLSSVVGDFQDGLTWLDYLPTLQVPIVKLVLFIKF